jgi:Zn-dependent M28 family amino/carboxypeptidase
MVLACSGGDVTPPAFDGERAYGYLVEQTKFGPRVPGTEASRAARSMYTQHFSSLGLAVDSQNFHFTDPYTGVDTPLVNIIARYRGDDDDSMAVLLVAHYDTRPRTDRAFDTTLQHLPITGANDGASGVAVLMELANLIAERGPSVNVDLVLVDGEDWGKAGDIDHYLLGARHYARTGVRGRYYFGIVVDLVGDRDQQIYREEYSQRFLPWLNDLVWQTAAELGIATFHDSTKWRVHDDHMALNVGGIPTIVVVDFDYPYWHTEHDTIDKCSPQALENVGRVIAKVLYTPSTWPTRK